MSPDRPHPVAAAVGLLVDLFAQLAAGVDDSVADVVTSGWLKPPRFRSGLARHPSSFPLSDPDQQTRDADTIATVVHQPGRAEGNSRLLPLAMLAQQCHLTPAPTTPTGELMFHRYLDPAAHLHPDTRAALLAACLGIEVANHRARAGGAEPPIGSIL